MSNTNSEAPLFDWADADMRDANPDRWTAARQRTSPNFAGPNVVEHLDEKRLTGQLLDVFNLMSDGRWRTVEEIRAIIGKGAVTGISAALRSLRKKQFGAHRVDKRRRGDPRSGNYEYKLVPRSTEPPVQL